MDQAKFGPAGNADSFHRQGFRKTIQVPEYLTGFQLDAYEYQCGRGVRISQESAKEFGGKANECGIQLSVHAPYYISLSSVEEEKRTKSIWYITETASAAKAMGAARIIVHSGSCSKMTREEALALACRTLKDAQDMLDEMKLGGVHICPETMGKINQLGTLEEVMALCGVDERMIPCIDFGHLNARTFGKMNSKEEFRYVLDTIQNELGSDRLKCFHSHFSKIEYTEKGGEKRHLTFEDHQYGPEFEPLAELIAQKGLAPTFICESAGTQAEDAAAMKQMYQEKLLSE